ncbi:hypothetical protein BD408DRAFT_8607 [Parasitella parasitica]|nr:hypothetical protein BD408DRAFT_8607 [Parasitella parasitica]
MNSSMLRHSPHSPYSTDSKLSTSRKSLGRYTRSELYELRERNLQMLSNQFVIDTLPDKGARLKETVQHIDKLLSSVFDEITPDNTNDMECPLTEKLQNIKPKRKSSTHTPSNVYSSIFVPQHAHGTSPPQNSQTSHTPQHTKVKMLTLNESLSLQTEQQSSVKECEKSLDFAHPSKSLLKSLNLSVDLIQQEINIDDVEFPAHFEEDEDDDVPVEPMMID